MRAIIVFIVIAVGVIGGLMVFTAVESSRRGQKTQQIVTQPAPPAKAAPMPRTKMLLRFTRQRPPLRSRPIYGYVEVAVQEEGGQETKTIATTPTTSSGSPWWVWLLAIGAVAGAVRWWQRRKKPAPRATVTFGR